MSRHRKTRFRAVKSLILLCISACLVAVGIGAIWVSTLKMPDLNSFKDRKIVESTKIYDRTGTILLYDTGTDAKLTVVPLSEISPFIQKASIAIEDSNFYSNIGIEPTSIVRAVLADFASGGFNQGASTITQQVVKNSLLTQDKTITRKIKEWVLAVKLSRSMSKDDILETYLNETPYGGTIYGAEEASRQFFGKAAKDVTLPEAAYLAAIPQAPSYYSPYGTHRDALTSREKIVLSRMKTLGLISDAEYKAAAAEKVTFLAKEAGGIRAPHFVMFVKDYLLQKYGEDMVDNNGLKVITTLDYDMQQKAESVVSKFGDSLAKNFNASNAALVAIDPKTGDILTMVGSRDYFDPKIDGNYNVAIAHRQPGSTFKPFVYSTLFKKGYTPETILFDTKTEFSTYCTPDGKPKNPSDDPKKVCYMPGEFDDTFMGPLTIRQALAQSRNIPAVKALYLAGIPDSIRTAEDLGITTLTDPNRYGLTLVLGGGEVSLLDMTSAYGVFANDGVRDPYRSILEVEDNHGNVLEKTGTAPSQVLPPEIARQISSILSDNNVRMQSLKPIADSVGRPVAIKTGTTNDYRDVWTLGYTPNLVVGAWAGNSDNTPMEHNVAGLIISPLWGAFMSQVAKNFPPENFGEPPPPLADGKAVMRGIWQGGVSYKIDTVSGKLATAYTPPETTKEIVFDNVHTILNWVNKDDPLGPAPADPAADTQYEYWEYSVRNWFTEWQKSHPDFRETAAIAIPTATDDVHLPDKAPKIGIIAPTENGVIDPNSRMAIELSSSGAYPPQKTEVYLNNKYVLTAEANPLNISFVPADISSLSASNTLSVVVYDKVFNKGEASVNFAVAASGI
ncbi:MAG: penicillin-binding protein [Candidatus Parcubacteria bacterium]|jgi:penicillin-binding protein 1C|nr:penicillin-binding protein [Candidatus Parcubacteria bacterium]